MTYSGKNKIFHGLIIIGAALLLSIIADFSGLSTLFERKTIDIRTKLCRMETPLPQDIVIILIDETSLQAMNEIAGRWPWPRYIHADLLDYLSFCGAESVVMDIIFSENQLPQAEIDTGVVSDDTRLVEATANAGNVFHAAEIILDHEDEFNTELLNKPLPEDFAEKFSIKTDGDAQNMSHNAYYLPFEELHNVSYGIGVVSFSADKDSVNRSEKLLFNYHNNYFPSHGFAPALKRLDYTKVATTQNAIQVYRKDGSALTIPVTDDGKYYTNMYGKYNTFSYSGVIESLIKVQNGITDNLMVPPDEFEGKIVFIGASAAATYDLKKTSIGQEVPGVFLHASNCGNILSEDFLKFQGFFTNLIPLLILLSFTVFSILFLRKITLQVYIPVILLGCYFGLSVLMFKNNIVIDVATPSFALVFSYIVSFTYISFTEGREKRKVKNILGQYVSPAMLSTVLESSTEEYLKAEVGAKENLTVFFSDIRGFTTISEKFPVEKVVETLNSYLSLMVDIIFQNNGTLDKFIGDAIVAFWGAPVKFDDHHYKAVLSAIQMIDALEGYNITNKKAGLPELQIGIGIHTDDVILGNIGSTKKLDYTVIGDGVNLTSRLEGLTKSYFSSILISETTYENVNDRICCRIADYVKVKGKNEPVIIYDVLGEADKISSETKTIANLTGEGFSAYKEKKFEEAVEIYRKIINLNPEDQLVMMFIERCREYMKESPPDEWDGCYTHTSK